MGSQRPDEEAIFDAARQLQSPQERRAYLDEACGDNTELRAAVEELLRLHDADRDFLKSPVVARAATIHVTPPSEQPGDVIGRYKLLEKIGEGGFGVVYMADQQEPVRRRVALKVIKLGMDTKMVIARFEAERQALAMMEHPNIARVLDAGATETGRPYFVMELVRGIPITEYCDQNNLSSKDRLDLFAQVCSAVQHAHQKGIIHRDLKPTNILVTRHDGTPVPKIIDFGVAKAMGRPLTDRTLFTAFRHFVGTPLYMSPEQATLSGLDVDTRSDIYALGVLLYELLTGTTPFEADRLRSAAYDEICRMIREEDPPKPSTRISTMGERAAGVASHRHTDTRTLRKLVHGDLDWIVMKALEKDRARRYETASEFAQDIQRHLGDEPVVAGPPGAVYRLRKFVRRNRVKVLAGALVAASLVAGLAVASVAVTQALRQRNRALAAYREKEEAEQRRQHAEQQAEAQREVAVAKQREAEEARQLANTEHEAKEEAEDALREERRWQLIAEAQLLMEDEDFEGALEALQEAAAQNNDRVTRLALWRLAEVYCDQPDAMADGVRGPLDFSPNGDFVAIGGFPTLWEPGSGETRALSGYGRCVAVSPDSATVATGGSDRLVKLWDVATGRELHSLSGHSTEVTAVAFSPQGTLLASGGQDGAVRLWDAVSGQCLRTLEWSDEVTSLAFSPDGSKLYTSEAGNPVAVWDVAGGIMTAATPDGGGGIWGDTLAVHPGGRVLVAAQSRSVVKLWQAPELRELYELTAWTDWLDFLALSTDGRTLALAAADGAIRFWDVAKRRYVGRTLRSGQTHQMLAFRPDSSALAVTGQEYQPQVWDVSQGRKLATMRNTPQGNLGGFSPDASMLAVWGTAGSQHSMELCDVSTGVVIRAFEPAGVGPRRVAFSADGTRVAASKFATNVHVNVWDVASGEHLGKLERDGSRVEAVEFSPDGAMLATGSRDGTVRIWDATSYEELHVLAGHDTAQAPYVAFSPDSTLLATAGGSLRLWDVARGRELRTLADECSPGPLAFSPDGAYLASMTPGFACWDTATGLSVPPITDSSSDASGFAFSPDGATLAVGKADGAICLWDLRAPTKPLVLEAEEGPAYNLAFSPDGAVLGSTSLKSASVWDVASGKRLRRIEGLPAPPWEDMVAFTPDGRFLVAPGLHSSAMLWDLDPPQGVRRVDGQSGGIFSVAVSPDGKTVVSGDGDGFIRLWDRKTGEQIRAQREHEGWVMGVAFSPDGHVIASAGLDKTLKLWETSTGLPLWTVQAHDKPVACVAFSPDGKTVATGSWDNSIRLWDAAEGRQRRTITGHPDHVEALAFSPDGALLASGDVAGNYGIWDANSGAMLYGLTTAEGGLVVTPPGEVPATWTAPSWTWGPAIRVSTDPNGKTILLRVGGDFDCMAFSPDGSLLALGAGDNSVRLWDMEVESEVRPLSGHAGRVLDVAFSPDGRHLVTAGGDRTVRLWDVETGQELRTFEGHEGLVYTVALAPDGREVFSGSLTDWSLRQWDFDTGREVRTLTRKVERTLCVAYSPDGKVLASAGAGKVIRLRDAATLEELNVLNGHTESVFSLSFAPDGRTLASTGHDGTIRLWDAGQGAELRTVDAHEGGAYSVAFSPDGALLASSGNDGTVKVWDAASLTQVRELTGHTGLVFQAAWSPDGKRLVSGGKEGIIRLWDVEEGTECLSLAGSGTAVWPVTFSRDGSRLVAGDPEGRIMVWDADTGEELQNLEAHGSAVRSLAFSADGKVMASASYDNTLKLWDTTHWQQIATLPPRPGKADVEDILSVAFSPDGSSIAAAQHTDLLVFDLDAHDEQIDRWIARAAEEGSRDVK